MVAEMAVVLDQANIRGAIAVLFGGESSERPVSLNSGAAVLQAFAALGQEVVPLDVKTADLADAIKQHNIKHCFIALHGGDGEDGTVQAILRSLGVTFTGSDTLGCAIAMDKQRTKLVWQGAGIPTANFVAVDAQSTWADVSGLLGTKMMIKPSNEGSSIGMSLVDSAASFVSAMTLALQYDCDVIAERWLSGKEYTVAILGEQVLPMIRLQPAATAAFYDYHAKYQSNDTQYLCPCGLPPEREQAIGRVALQAFKLVGCKGWGRIDVMEDGDGQFYLLEANTAPGMTDHSLVPMAAKAVGLSFPALVATIFNLSVKSV